MDRHGWTQGELQDIVEPISNHLKTEGTSEIRAVGLEHLDGTQLRVIGSELVAGNTTFTKTFDPGDILFGRRRAYLRKLAVADFKGVCSGDIVVLRPRSAVVLPELPVIYLTSDRFTEFAVATSAGSLSPRTKWKDLASYSIQIPPVDQQKRIVDLFQSIEKYILQADDQEHSLRALSLAITNQFVSDQPRFGKLLDRKPLTRVRYADVVEKQTRRIDPVKQGIRRIVAGEDLSTEDFKIRTWSTVGKDFLGPAFHMHFVPGDILYGSRRTYLKKVAYAEFEGVCANTTYVLRAREDALLQDLLKHVMLSERFTAYSIGVSKGSTNPYINWKDLNEFEFQIPDLPTQRLMAGLLDEILATAEEVHNHVQDLRRFKQVLVDEILG